MRVAEAAAEHPAVVLLSDPRAADRTTVGPKAAALAEAARAGLPVVDGFVIAPDAAMAIARRRVESDAAPDVLAHANPEIAAALEAWSSLSSAGADPVVVRSSARDEDGAVSSNAGRFTSVLDVDGAAEFLDAVVTVVTSAARVHDVDDAAQMAVLVQRAVAPTVAGVAFGQDPVSGRADRAVIAAVSGHPAALVGGEVEGERIVLTRNGRVVERSGGSAPQPILRGTQRRAVVRLGRQAERWFGGAQDIEWAFDGTGKLWLLQSRPITAVGKVGTGPRFGPGPVAETFPERLAPLEEELWVDPLRRALAESISLVGAAPRQRLRSSPVVVCVGGWVAVDLDLVAGRTAKARGLARLDPRPALRRLAAAWRVGRLRAALPSLVDDLVAKVDAELQWTPDLALITDEKLLAVLDRAPQVLTALHGHEVLAGALEGPTGEAVTAVSLALRAVVAGRAEGLVDAELVARDPVVLSLVAPSMTAPLRIGEVAGGRPDDRAPVDLSLLGPREALRLRARWVQELTVAVVRELAARAAEHGRRVDRADLALLGVDELVTWYRTGALPSDLPRRRRRPETPPLPTAFRLADDGSVVAERDGERDGQAAGGGRGIGVVHVGDGEPPDGAVIVVQTLDPRLAGWLPKLAGLVAETGSPLSHLAILARELGVPTVVGVPAARERFGPGTTVVVDGGTGEVSVVESPGDGRRAVSL